MAARKRRKMERQNLEEKQETAKGRILAAALDVFAEKGYNGATTREIVKAAGSSLSMLNLCFGSKENLYKEVLKEILSVYVYSVFPVFHEIIEIRGHGEMTGETAWHYIEQITGLHLQIIMNSENRSAITVLNRELQDKKCFLSDLEPALMYIYHYQLLFEEYTKSPYQSRWSYILAFQTVTGMFNLLTYPKLLDPFEAGNPMVEEGVFTSDEIMEFEQVYEIVSKDL